MFVKLSLLKLTSSKAKATNFLFDQKHQEFGRLNLRLCADTYNFTQNDTFYARIIIQKPHLPILVDKNNKFEI